MNHQRESQRALPPRLRAGWIESSLVLATCVGVVLSKGRLRPILDDYCLADQTRRGLLHAVANNALNWSGDVTTFFLHHGLSGWAILNLPLTLSSALPTLLGTLIVIALFAKQDVNVDRQGINKRKPSRFVFSARLTLVVFLLWETYKGAISGFGLLGDASQEIGNGLVYWQTLQTGYVIPTALAAIALQILYVFPYAANYHPAPKSSMLMPVLLGIAIGTSGLIISFGTFLTAVVLTLHHLRHSRVKLFVQSQLFPASCAAASIAVYFSPGTTARRAFEDSVRSPIALTASRETLEAVAQGVFNGFIAWGRLVFSWSTLWIIVLATVLFLSHSTIHNSVASIAFSYRRGATHLLHSLFLTVSASLAGPFVYEAWWHRLPAIVALFAALVTISHVGVRHFFDANQARIRTVWLWRIAGVIALAFVTHQSARVAQDLELRAQEWESGPAPVVGIPDTDHAGSADCWARVLEDMRFPLAR